MSFKLKLLYRFFIWITNFIDIFDSLISIITFTFYHPNLGFKFITWQSKLILKLRQNEN